MPAMRELCAEYKPDGSFDLKIGDGVTAWNSLPYISSRDLADLVDDELHRTVTDAEKAAWNAKQNALTFDDAPTENSDNPVKSGGIFVVLADKANKSEIPDVSAFITKAVDDLVNYYGKAEIDGKVANLNAAISAIPKFAIKVVNSLPADEISATTVYLLKTSTTESGNLYTEYIYVDGTWEALGTQTLDLTSYATKDYVTTAIANFLTSEQIVEIVNNALAAYARLSDLTAYVKTADVAAIALSGNLSDAVQDETHRTVTDAEKAKWNAKQDALTIDTTPTSGSTNPVSSGAVHTALADKAGKNEIVTASTGLSDSADLMRTGDTVTINGGGV
ncbi:MAG: hypothetical protein NC548_26200 [Lachnospiraceae bacterium]|nr:hypothetical protein [Lachnospiraceae bacterium]